MRALSFRLTVTVGAIVLVAVAAVSLAGWFAGRSVILTQVHERERETSASAMSQVDAYLAARVEELRSMVSSQLQVAKLSAVDRTRILSDFTYAFGSNRYTDISMIDSHGRQIASTGNPDFTALPDVLRAVNSSVKPGLTGLVRYPDQAQDVFVVYAPLIDENFTRTGTLVARLQTTELAALVRAIPVDDRTGVFLVHGRSEMASVRGKNAPQFAQLASASKAQAASTTGGMALSVVTAIDAAQALLPVNTLGVQATVAGLIVLLLALLATIWTARRLAEPLRVVAAAATRLAGGDLGAHAEVRTDVRETQDLADAFNAMSAALREVIGDVGHASRAIAETVRATLESARQVRGESEEQAVATQQIAGALAGASSGTRAIGADAAELERSAKDGLTSLDTLLREVDGTTAAIEQLRSSVERSNDAGRALSVQASAVAGRARDVAERATGAQASAGAGDEAVRRLVGDIELIGGSIADTAGRLEHLAAATAGAIRTQVEVIEDMAERSKLLALNAGIEAARAGEQGRGFSVIAQELHRLASGSKVASDEVKALVAGVVAETQSLVDGARRANGLAEGAMARARLTGETITALVSEINENADNARAIGATAEEQAARTAEIELATGEMRRMAESTARAAAVVGELSRRVLRSVDLAARVAAKVAGAAREQQTSFAIIERGAGDIGAATQLVAGAAQRSVDATGALRDEIDRLADRVGRFGAGDAAPQPDDDEAPLQPYRAASVRAMSAADFLASGGAMTSASLPHPIDHLTISNGSTTR